MKPKHLLALGVLAAVAAASLTAAQKPAPAQPTEQQKLKDRVDAHDSDIKVLKEKADRAAIEKDYIERTQKDTEKYYERAFDTQLKFLDWIVILIAAAPLLVGLLSFRAIDRRIQDRLRHASTQLRTEFNQRLDERFTELARKNADQIEELEGALTKRVQQATQDLTIKDNFQFQFGQGLTMLIDGSFGLARNHFRLALAAYKNGKPHQLFHPAQGIRALLNIFASFHREDQNTQQQKAKTELASPFYDDLHAELAEAALELTWLAAPVRERKEATPAPESATTEAAPVTQPEEPAHPTPPNKSAPK
jgi:hypothetical protein